VKGFTFPAFDSMPNLSPSMEDQEANIFVTLWKEKRVISIAFFIAFSQFQYGFDSAAVSGFQGMTGFLAVFGFIDVSSSHSPKPPIIPSTPKRTSLTLPSPKVQTGTTSAQESKP